MVVRLSATPELCGGGKAFVPGRMHGAAVGAAGDFKIDDREAGRARAQEPDPWTPTRD